ncbi:hypothetical protein P8452_31214 [Trifolium repens]|nr:hypothetical protein P8452_31214 [Trifolium repens]
MAKIIIFVYTLIIFLSLLLVGTGRTRIPCESDDDCPEHFLPPVMTCIDGYCMYENDICMMADHDRRRKAMRKQRSVHANQEKGTQTNNDDFVVEIKGGHHDQEDLDEILHQLSRTYLTGLSAKAA